MKKALAVGLVLLVCSFAVGLALMAPEPSRANAAVSVSVPAVPALDSPPVVLETSAVLVLTPARKEAPKPRPVAARPKAKTWQCGEPRTVGEAGRLSQRPSDAPQVRVCEWR